jgi:hypothetical protein
LIRIAEREKDRERERERERENPQTHESQETKLTSVECIPWLSVILLFGVQFQIQYSLRKTVFNEITSVSMKIQLSFKHFLSLMLKLKL